MPGLAPPQGLALRDVRYRDEDAGERQETQEF